MVDFILGSDGAGSDVIQVPAGWTMLPAWEATQKEDFYFSMDGRKVYEFACDKGSGVIRQLCSRNNIKPDVVISHQANANIIRAIAERSGIEYDLFYVDLDRFANLASTAAAFELFVRPALRRLGSGPMRSIQGANPLVRLPVDLPTLDAGERVEVIPMYPAPLVGEF